MPSIRSNSQRRVIINRGDDTNAVGHRVSGLANDPRPIQYESFGEFVNIEHGRDGSMIVDTEPGNIFGTNITIKVIHDSPTVKWALRQYLAKQNNERMGLPHRTYSMTDNDPASGVLNTLVGGVLRDTSRNPEPGQLFEVMFAFEWHIPNPDGMIVRLPPAFAVAN